MLFSEKWRMPLGIMVVLVLGGVMVWFGGAGMDAAHAQTGPIPTTSILTTRTIPHMVKGVENAVVQITSVIPQSGGKSGLGGQNYSEALGSGFFIGNSGEIVTNEHVINGASSISVHIPGHTRLYPAKVIGKDYNIDLALIKVNVPFAVAHLVLASPSSIQVGQFAVAIGNPEGLTQTVTLGIISSEGRPITISNRQYVNLLQTDAAINPGNSGGPLLNVAGQVIGVNTAVETNAQGIGFAIPVSELMQAIPYLSKGQTEPQAWLGVEIQTMDPQTAGQMGLPSLYGAYVAGVLSGGPAAKAGLTRGDVITGFNGTPVTSSTDLLDDVYGEKPGTVVSLNVWGKHGTKVVRVQLATKPQNIPLG